MRKKIFIDCGGHDGCSVVRFLWKRPQFKSITFEPNPIFSRYYSLLPSELIRKVVSTYDGTVAFTVDPVDGDGSSICPGKGVVYDRSLSNYQCPTIRADCIDLSNFLARRVRDEDYLCLKLDVEGAEYAILEKMIADGTIDLVDELFIEFHWDKCGIPEQVHDRLRKELEQRTVVRHWDAAAYSIHRKGLQRMLLRGLMLVGIWSRRIVASARGT